MKPTSIIYYFLIAISNLFLVSAVVSAQITVPPTKTYDVTAREFKIRKLIDIQKVIMGGSIDRVIYKMGHGEWIMVRIGGISGEDTMALIVLEEGVGNIEEVGIRE